MTGTAFCRGRGAGRPWSSPVGRAGRAGPAGGAPGPRAGRDVRGGSL